MAHFKKVMTAALAVLVLASLPAAAHWHRRCGFDRYGYLPPDFRGCAWYGYGAGVVPIHEPVVPVIPYVRAPVLDYPPPPNCYYDNGYDFRVHLVCRACPSPYPPE
jgi:hypothetical protein